MVDNVIVSVQAWDKALNCDLELPANLSIAALEPLLLEALRNMCPEKWEDIHSIHLQCGRTILSPESTLADNGIWDGSILTVIGKGV